MEKHHEITLKSSLNLIISPSYHDIPMVSPYITWYFDPLSAVDPPFVPWVFPELVPQDAYLAAVVNEQGRQLDVGISDSNALALVARQVSQKDEAEATAVNIQGLVNVPFWGYWTSPLNGNYR